MTAVPSPARPLGNSFSLGVGGHVGGDPMHGLLAAQLRYVARLAHGMDPRLGLGSLISVSTTGTRPVSAQVSWDLGGECLLRGHVFGPLPAGLPSPGLSLVDPGTTWDASALACLALLHDLPGLAWGVLVRRDRAVVASVGEPLLDTLNDVAVRAAGVLAGLDAQHRETCVWLGFEGASVVVAPLGTACVVLCLRTLEEDAVVGALESVRATVADVDLDRVTPLAEPFRPAPTVDEVEWDGPDDPADEWAGDDWAGDGWELPSNDVPLTGARFAGAVGSTPRRRRHREGRWFGRAD